MFVTINQSVKRTIKYNDMCDKKYTYSNDRISKKIFYTVLEKTYIIYGETNKRKKLYSYDKWTCRCVCMCVTARWCISHSLSIMTDIVENLSAEGVSRSKQMCHAALRDYIHITLCLVPIYVHDYGKTSCLGFEWLFLMIILICNLMSSSYPQDYFS